MCGGAPIVGRAVAVRAQVLVAACMGCAPGRGRTACAAGQASGPCPGKAICFSLHCDVHVSIISAAMGRNVQRSDALDCFRAAMSWVDCSAKRPAAPWGPNTELYSAVQPTLYFFDSSVRQTSVVCSSFTRNADSSSTSPTMLRSCGLHFFSTTGSSLKNSTKLRWQKQQH